MRLGLVAWLAVTAAPFLFADQTPPTPLPAKASSSTTPPAPPTPPAEAAPIESLADWVNNAATGVILPDEPLPARLVMQADAAKVWQVKGTQHILLDAHAAISIGSYGFKARRAVVLLTPLTMTGRKVHRMALYLDSVTELGGFGPISAEAPRLLITAVLEGPVQLKTALLKRQAAMSDPLVVAALHRTARYYQALEQNTIDLPAGPPLYGPKVFAERAKRQQALRQGVAPPVTIAATPTPTPPVQPTPPGQPTPPAPVVPQETGQQLAGAIDFAADRIVGKPGKGDQEGTILLLGNIRVMYQDPRTRRTMSLTADKAVILLAPDADPNAAQPLASQVHGIYLEDNVIATDGQYTLRGPRVFYDLARDKAIVLDGVFYTWDIRQQVPIYVRARTVRQESLKQWDARAATVSTSEFHEPHLALGAKDLTIRRTDQPPTGQPSYRLRAKDVTVRFADVPVFWWPSVAGRISDMPLRSVGMDVNSRDGVVARTEWDLFSLLGKDRPKGVDASLIGDVYTNRGGAVGLEADYDTPKAYGSLDSYLMFDTGEDEPGGREKIDPENDVRGRVRWQHRHMLPANWQATFEVGYVSDPTFLEEFFPQDAYAEKTYETLAYFKKQQADSAFTFLISNDLLDYPTNLSILQRPGYTVDKLPEAAYFRIGTPLLGNRLTWYSENRASAMRLNLPKRSPADYAFTNADSIALFGMAAGTRFDTALKAAGYDDDTRYRFDTRQEVQLPLKIGWLDVVPFVTGRFTGYDQDFAAFAGNGDNMRFWGAVGARLHAAFHRTYDQVDSSLFDLHRIRHIIEPSATLFHAATTIEQHELPVYDDDIESLLDGSVVRLGLRNTLQTQRGGPNRWRSVDWLRVDTDLVLHDGQDVIESPVPRMFDYRPELSLTGDHFWSQAVWQITDTFIGSGDYTYSLESNDSVQWGAGVRMDHSPRLSSFVETRRIVPLKTFYVRYGVEYLLTPKYHISLSHGYDFDRHSSRSFSIIVTRRLPRMLLMVGIDIDTVADEQSVGIALAPEGLGGPAKPIHNPFMRGHEFAP